MNEAEVYQKQQLGGRLSKGKKPALIVVDFVNGFIDPDMFGGGNILEAAQATVPVLQAFRDKEFPVVFTRIVYADDGSDAGAWCEKAPRLRELTESAPASQVVDFLQPVAGELIVRKTQASAFFDTSLSSVLRQKGVDAVAVVGATTSGCVRATVVDAISSNLRPTLLSDCVGDRALAPHGANIFDMEQKYANVIASRDLSELFA